MEIFIFCCPGKKKSGTLGANYSAVLDFDLRKSPSGLNLTGTEGSWQQSTSYKSSLCLGGQI